MGPDVRVKNAVRLLSKLTLTVPLTYSNYGNLLGGQTDTSYLFKSTVFTKKHASSQPLIHLKDTICMCGVSTYQFLFLWKQNQWISRCAPALCLHLRAVMWSSPVETPNIAPCVNVCLNTSSSPRTRHVLFSSLCMHPSLCKVPYPLSLRCVFALDGNVKCSTPMSYCS